MKVVPFWLDLQFAGFADEATPFSPVDGITLGWFDGKGLCVSKFGFGGCSEDLMFAEAAKGLGKLQSVNAIPVGWDLRRLVWPAFVNGCLRNSVSLPQKFVMRPETKWNNLDMVDLQGLMCQGGYSPNWHPTIGEAKAFFRIEPGTPDINAMFLIYKRYVELEFPNA